MKQLLPFLIYMMPLCAVAQDLIVTTDNDTLPCRIVFVAGGEIAFVGQGLNDQSKVLLSQVGSYRFGGRWQQVGGSDSFMPITQVSEADKPSFRLPAQHFKTGGYLLAAAGGMFIGGAALSLAYYGSNSTQQVNFNGNLIDVPQNGAIELAYASYGLFVAGALLTVSAGFEIAAGGVKLAQIQRVNVK
jgi:hypothetical protein